MTNASNGTRARPPGPPPDERWVARRSPESVFPSNNHITSIVHAAHTQRRQSATRSANKLDKATEGTQRKSGNLQQHETAHICDDRDSLWRGQSTDLVVPPQYHTRTTAFGFYSASFHSFSQSRETEKHANKVVWKPRADYCLAIHRSLRAPERWGT